MSNVTSARPFPPTRWQKFRKNVYNPQKKQVLGRTAGGWKQVGIFYSVFLSALIVLFAICMGGLLYTLDSKAPKWKLSENLIGTNPGLGFRPLSLDESSLVWYNRKVPSTINKWVKLLDEFLAPYWNQPKNAQKCSFNKKPKPRSICAVDVTQFGPCSSELQYGYNDSSPCIFIKLNKIYGWIPKFYTEPVKGMPAGLIATIRDLPKEQRRQVWISCNGEEPVDKEHVEGFRYYPRQGFPGYYYPYLNVENYLSPLIAVEIVKPKPNIIINIECRAWAKNIFYKGSKNDRQGSVHIEILNVVD